MKYNATFSTTNCINDVDNFKYIQHFKLLRDSET